MILIGLERRDYRQDRPSGYQVSYTTEVEVEIVFASPSRADEYAHDMSTDPGVLAGTLTPLHPLTLRVNGHPESLYVTGERQEVAHLSDDHTVAAHCLKHPVLRGSTRGM